MTTEPYTYAFLRQDISFEQQIVQIFHVGVQGGETFANDPVKHRNAVVIGVASEAELLGIEQYLAENGIRFTTFYEPDNRMGHSAICTEHLNDRKKRKALADFTLLKVRFDLAPPELRTEQDAVA